ncbi:hypothetical protein [Brevundimonas vesicularis]|nr:hypothetical protein [Brevundimonas vesicularis]
MDDHLAKPLQLPALVATLSKYLDKSNAPIASDTTAPGRFATH